MLSQIIAMVAFATAQGIPAQDAARMHAAELLLKGNTARLVSEARSPDLTIKRNAIWALGQTGDVKFLPIILDATKEPETDEEAIRGLHSIGLPAYRAVLKKALIGPVVERRMAGSLLRSLALGTHGPRPNQVIPLLWELRNSDIPTIRNAALYGLEYADDATKIQGYASFLDDPSPFNRELAARFLGGRRVDRALNIRLLKMSASDSDVRVRGTIIVNRFWAGVIDPNTLEPEHFEAMMHALSDDPRVAGQALRIVSQLAGPIGRLAAANSIRRRPETADHIAEVQRTWDSDPLRERVYEWVSSPDEGIRRDAILALAALRDPRALDLLLAWNPTEPWERNRMLEAIGWTDDPHAARHLMVVAAQPNLSPDEKAAVATAFGYLGINTDFLTAMLLDKSVSSNHRGDVARAVTVPNEKFIDAVFSVIGDPTDDPKVRGSLLWITPQLDAARAFDLAVWVLGRPEDKRIHWQAVGVFEQIGDPKAIPYIEKALLNEPDDTLKRVGERALKALRGG